MCFKVSLFSVPLLIGAEACCVFMSFVAFTVHMSNTFPDVLLIWLLHDLVHAWDRNTEIVQKIVLIEIAGV